MSPLRLQTKRIACQAIAGTPIMDLHLVRRNLAPKARGEWAALHLCGAFRSGAQVF
jgi:hypothetical protein